MSNEDKVFYVFVVLVIVALFVAIFGIAYFMGAKTCSAQTQNIGFESKYGFFSGCMIEIEPEIWIPLDNYRFFGDE